MFEISPAIGCPIDCCHCPQSKINAAYSGPRLMTAETYLTCIDKIPDDSVVSFAGFAEPYLNKRCTDFILYAHGQGFPVLLYTTCVGMNLDDVERLRDLPFKILCLHLPDAKGNAKINVTPEYLAVVDALIQSHPGADLMSMGKAHEALGEYRVQDRMMHTRAGNVNGTPPYKSGKLVCTQNAEQKDNILLPNADLTLCCNDYSLRHVIGNLVRQSYEEIFASEPYLSIRNAMMNGGDLLCRTCEFALQRE